MRKRSRVRNPGVDNLSRVPNYRGYDLLPEVKLIPEGEVFGGMWIVACCRIGASGPDGYEIRTLVGDNDHFATRRYALQAAFLRAMRTIDLGEVQAVHLCSLPQGAGPAKRAHRRRAPSRFTLV